MSPAILSFTSPTRFPIIYGSIAPNLFLHHSKDTWGKNTRSITWPPSSRFLAISLSCSCCPPGFTNTPYFSEFSLVYGIPWCWVNWLMSSICRRMEGKGGRSLVRINYASSHTYKIRLGNRFFAYFSLQNYQLRTQYGQIRNQYTSTNDLAGLIE